MTIARTFLAAAAIFAVCAAAASDADAKKRKRYARPAASAAVAAAIANAPHASRLEGGRICYIDHYHYGSGSGPSRAAAERDAAGSWASFTSFEYGSAWANYGKAASKKMTCSDSGGSWSCSVEARPCR